MKMKKLLLSLMLLSLGIYSMAQGVTTSAISGSVLDSSGEPVAFATVVAVHEPTGTNYGTTTRDDGRFNLANIRPGGPYTITVSFVGYSPAVFSEVSLSLGEDRNFSIVLTDEGLDIDEVLIVGVRAGSVGQNTGTSTRITSENIETIPSISRNFFDYIKITPQSGSYGGGVTFAGVNNRYNAIYIDGAVNNDVFGLSSSGTNGGQTGITPFSVDIIDQFQVVISPYDVTLGGFAGGGINAVTKSGTNTFKGSAYTYMKNENLVGKTNGTLADRLDIDREKVDEFAESVYGFSLGGPIIKDKLFFFANVELQRDETPRPFNIEEYTSVAGRVSATDLENLRQHLITNYNYDPGIFGSTKNELSGEKIFAKVDYNINSNHRLTLRHQYTKADQYSRYSGSSSTINFSNNGIYFPSTTNSSALELNSRFGATMSNNLIVSYVTVRDDRDPIGNPFPYVFIEDVSSGVIRFGSEEFSTANRLDQDIFSITNNFNLYKGAHKFTFGTHNEFYNIYNVFIGQNYGTYRFASLNDFLTNQPATRYDRSYSLIDNTTGDITDAAADFRAMQLGFYLQDEWRVNPKLIITGGLRLDVPIITSDPAVDPANYLNEVALPLMAAQYPIAEGVVGGEAPDGQLMFSPRLGFSYDIQGNSKNIIRGGAGVFTSRIPFVWPGAMFTNNGLTLGRVNQGNIVGDVFFISDYQNQYVHPNPTVPAGQIDIFTKDFKYPQIFRTNLAYDFELPGGIISTIEGLYTKTLNNINYTNINSDPVVAFQWTGTPDDRNVYVNQNIDNTYSAVYLASNTSKGYTYNISASLAKDFDFGLSAVVSYSYGDAYALSEGTSSQNSSQWRGQVNVDGRNNPAYGRSDFAVGHRFLTSLSYAYKWTKDGNNKTTISLFFNGQSGNPFSYVIAGGITAQNVNRERGSVNANRSLVWIPKDQSEINLVDYVVAGNTVTAATQWANLNALIEDDAYLSNNRGKYAEKNGAWAPFTNLFDLSIRQDFGVKAGGQNHKFQISLDIYNLGNLINSSWGTVYSVPGSFNNYYLYQFEGYEADGTTPRFTFRSDKVGFDRYNINSLASRWTMLFGVRYIFN